jgi:hypothetical protein
MNKRKLLRSVFFSGLSLVLWFGFGDSRPAGATQTASTFEKQVRPFLASTCYGCHNATVKAGDLNLELYQTAASFSQSRGVFERVLRKLRAGEMPPKSVPRPDENELKAVIASIESELDIEARLSKPDPGRVTARRLNRAEYNNTVRDLAGVALRPADDFPQDDSGYGFDNIGDVLSLSPVLMEKYLSAAEKVARTAIFGPEELKPTMTRHRVPGRAVVPSRTPLFDYDLTGLTLAAAVHTAQRFPVDGEYIIRVFLGGSRPVGSEPFQIALWIDDRKVQAVEFDPVKTAVFDDLEKQELGGKAQEFRLRVPAGDHRVSASIPRFYEGLPARYKGPNPSPRTVAPPRFNPPPRLPPDKVAERRKEFEERLAAAEKAPVNEARINALEIGGPYNQAKGPSPDSLRKIYTCGHLNGKHRLSCARMIVSTLARRAFRRPVTLHEINRLIALVAQAQKRGDPFEEGLCQALQALLVSPHFLFRVEQGDGVSRTDAPHPIRQHELASRLSYFLWSSMPDDELLDLADRRRLREPAVLAAQVLRMLKDRRAASLVENFGGQWLELRKLESVRPDRKRFPEFDEYLRASMQRETEMFFANIIREDRGILDFIDADYSFINERLARLYRIPGVTGPEFRNVRLPADSRRGGVVTQASILTVSSLATRTSPVLRGKWILDKILNAPPPPPLPDVPNLDETRIGTAASLREQLEMHRQNATCASCHARMDPLGFGLENFDAIGAWREQDGRFPIDASGLLPDGRSFKGPEELKAILKSDRDAFAESLTEKLLTYALGRGLESYDKPAVKKIVTRLSAEDYRFSSLIRGIVESLPFQMRRGGRTP